MAIKKNVLSADTFSQVDVDFMNDTHFEELVLVMSLGEMLNNYQQGPDDQAISEVLNRWLEHTKAHFSRENELMVETKFPAYAVHAGEHQNALEAMQGVVSLWEDSSNIEELSGYVFDIWPEWFEQHVNSMDMMTAKFATMQGYKQGSK